MLLSVLLLLELLSWERWVFPVVSLEPVVPEPPEPLPVVPEP